MKNRINFPPIFISVLVVLLVTACNFYRPEGDRAQYSYALGYQIGQNMKAQGIILEPEAFAAAVADAMNDNVPALSDKEMRDAVKKVALERKRKEEN